MLLGLFSYSIPSEMNIILSPGFRCPASAFSVTAAVPLFPLFFRELGFNQHDIVICYLLSADAHIALDVVMLPKPERKDCQWAK